MLFFLCRSSWPLYLVKGSSSLAMKKPMLNFSLLYLLPSKCNCLLNATVLMQLSCINTGVQVMAYFCHTAMRVVLFWVFVSCLPVLFWKVTLLWFQVTCPSSCVTGLIVSHSIRVSILLWGLLPRLFLCVFCIFFHLYRFLAFPRLVIVVHSRFICHSV